MNTYGSLYERYFDQLKPSVSRIKEDDDGGSDRQFKLITNLESPWAYVLVVTTSFQSETGSFSVIALGPNKLTLTHWGEYIFILFNKLSE